MKQEEDFALWNQFLEGDELPPPLIRANVILSPSYECPVYTCYMQRL